MVVLQRVLVLILVIEIAGSTALLLRQRGHIAAMLPAEPLDDPLLGAQLRELADGTRGGNARDWLRLAEGLLGKGYYVEAEHSFRQVLAIEPESHPARFGLAFCLDRTGRSEECRTEYLRAAALPVEPGEIETSRQHALYAIGRSHLRDSAADAAEKAFQENKGFPPADYQLCKLWIRSGRTEMALPLIDQNLKRFPQSLVFTFLRYRAALALDDDSTAVAAADALERCRYQIPLAFGTNYVEPLSKRLGLSRELEQYNQSIASGDQNAMAAILERIQKRVGDRPIPQRDVVSIRLGEVEFQRQDPQALQRIVDSLREWKVANADVLQLAAAAKILAGRSAEAVQLLDRAAQMSPNVPLLQMLATQYRVLGEADRERSTLAKANFLAASIDYEENRYPQARMAISRSIELNAHDEMAWFYRGEIERVLGDVDAAQAAYRQCIALNPASTRAKQRIKWLSEMDLAP